jgi:hypothetical protein
MQGRIQRGAHPARAPPKIGKNMIFWGKIVIFKEQELLTILQPLSSPPVFSGVRVTRSLVLCVCFVDRCLSFFFSSLRCLFFFDLRILIDPVVCLSKQTSLIGPYTSSTADYAFLD